jgi:glycerol-3-phosphate acyltransferase PlsY
MWLFMVAIAGYLLGSISFSYLIVKQLKGIDIRKHGSGNAGATNTQRILGTGPALFVLLLDALKGAVAVWIGSALGDASSFYAIIGGVAAVIGHNWPIFLGFKGGKGIATTLGVMLTVAFVPTLIASLITLLVIALTRYVSLGSMTLLVLIPLLMYLFDFPSSVIVCTLFISVLGIFRHHENIRRLFAGTERKIGKSTQI